MGRSRRRQNSNNPPKPTGQNKATPAKPDKWNLILGGIIAFITAASLLTAILFYFDVIPIAMPEAQNSSINFTLCKHLDSGTCGHFTDMATERFFNIPLEIKPSDSRIVQNHEVMMSSVMGSISGNLAEGLDSVAIKYQGSEMYRDNTNGGFSYGDNGLTLEPITDAPSYLKIKDSAGLVGDPASFMWQSEGTFYPTVTLRYHDGNLTTFDFPDTQIHVQSESDFDNEKMQFISARKTEIYTLISIIGVTLGAIPAIIVAFRRKKGSIIDDG